MSRKKTPEKKQGSTPRKARTSTKEGVTKNIVTPPLENQAAPQAETPPNPEPMPELVKVSVRFDQRTKRVEVEDAAGQKLYHRKRFDPEMPKHVKELCKGVQERLDCLGATQGKVLRLDVPDVDQQVLQQAQEAMDREIQEDKQATEQASPERQSQADMFVEVLFKSNIDLFHCGENVFASLEQKGHRETWPLHSRGFKSWATRRYYETYNRTPTNQALVDTLALLAGKAIFDGPEIVTAVRIAGNEEIIFLDLANEQWQVVAITPQGWQVIPAVECPVRFVRPKGMKSLPMPVPGGSLEPLRKLLHLTEPQWTLFIAWVVAALRPGYPYPILAVNGEQGSAKTSHCRIACNLIDPHVLPLRRPPRDERDLMINAANSGVVAYDNLSGLQVWLSDALCALSTGGGMGTRQLYSDDEEKLFDAIRPIIINGIEDLGERPDLVDRCLALKLEEINEEERITEKALWATFSRIHAQVLGVLLDAVACGLKNLPHTKLARLPRMADFVQWIVAAEPGLNWKPGAFVEVYDQNRKSASTTALESSVVAQTLIAFMTAKETWVGTYKDLLHDLEPYAGERVIKSKAWPQTPRGLSGKIKRIAPNLRRAGIGIQEGTHEREGNTITINKVCKAPSQRSPCSQPRQECDKSSEHCGEHSTEGDFQCSQPGAAREHCTNGQSQPSRQPSHQRSHVSPHPECSGEGCEHCEGASAPFSNGETRHAATEDHETVEMEV